MKEFIAALAVTLICSLAPLAVYALRKCGFANFNVFDWLKSNRDRFIVAGASDLIFTAVMFFVPQAGAVFAASGLQVTGATYALVGVAVGALLVAAMGGRSAQDEPKTKGENL